MVRKKVLDKTQLEDLYHNQSMSLRGIAKHLNVSVTTVVKYMKQYAVETRDQSAAQHVVLKEKGHPMLGKTHSDKTKKRISKSLGNFWDGLTDEERLEYKKLVGSGWKNKWESMSSDERQKTLSKLNEASRSQQGNGSRFERFLASELRLRGYVVEERTHNYMPSARFEVDIALPKQRVMIEVDGPTHFIDLYESDALERQQQRDGSKNSYLTNAGFKVLRIRDNNGPLSQRRIELIVSAIEQVMSDNRNIVWYMDHEFWRLSDKEPN